MGDGAGSRGDVEGGEVESCVGAAVAGGYQYVFMKSVLLPRLEVNLGGCAHPNANNGGLPTLS